MNLEVAFLNVYSQTELPEGLNLNSVKPSKLTIIITRLVSRLRGKAKGGNLQMNI